MKTSTPSYLRALSRRTPEETAATLRPPRVPLWGLSRAAGLDSANEMPVTVADAAPPRIAEAPNVAGPGPGVEPSLVRPETAAQGISIAIASQSLTETDFFRAPQPRAVAGAPLALERRLQHDSGFAPSSRRDLSQPQTVPSPASGFTQGPIPEMKSPGEGPHSEENRQTAKPESEVDRKPATRPLQQQLHAHELVPVRDTESRLISARPSWPSEKLSRPSVNAPDEEADRAAVGMEVQVTRPSKSSSATEDRSAQPVRYMAAAGPEAGSARNLNDTPAGNNVHIGNVDIQITPLATPPVKQPARQSVSTSVPVLSRGFVTAFGLRQT